MDKVDVTLPVLIDNAVIEYKNATMHIVNDLGISDYLAEIAMEKALLSMKEQRMSLYASALFHSNAKEAVKNNGDQDD